MHSRGFTWFTAVVFLSVGIFLSVLGWQKKWHAKGVGLRVGGLAALVAGGYSVLMTRR